MSTRTVQSHVGCCFRFPSSCGALITSRIFLFFFFGSGVFISPPSSVLPPPPSPSPNPHLPPTPTPTNTGLKKKKEGTIFTFIPTRSGLVGFITACSGLSGFKTFLPPTSFSSQLSCGCEEQRPLVGVLSAPPPLLPLYPPPSAVSLKLLK